MLDDGLAPDSIFGVCSKAIVSPMIHTRLPLLDGLRGVAILTVMCRHFGLAYPVTTWFDQAISTAFMLGWCGVDLFFVLSGFLITGILIDTRDATNYFRSFWARRILRIVPAYYSFLAIWFIILPVLTQVSGLHPDLGEAHQLPYWTWTANLFGGVYQLGHLWSLSVEEQFYLIWPLVVFQLSNKRLFAACLLLVIACPLIRLVLASEVLTITWPLQIFSRWDGLALGAIVALLYRDEVSMREANRWWKGVLAAALVGLTIVCVAIGTVDLQDASNPVASIGISFIDLCFAAILIGALSSPQQFSWLETRWLRNFGLYSYAIYLFHGPLAHIAMHALPVSRWSPLLQSRAIYIGFMACCFALSFLAAFISWHLIEKRFLTLKDRVKYRSDKADQASAIAGPHNPP